MPASTRAASLSSSFDAGPMVATIFVRRSGFGTPGRLAVRPEGGPAWVLRPLAELLLDPEELVVLRDAVRARRCARLDLTRVHRHREVGDGRVLRLARAVGDDGRVPGRTGELDHVERLGERPDLVDFHENRVRDALVDAAAEKPNVRDEEVVADELDPVADGIRQRTPVRPGVLLEPVLDGDDREPVRKRVVEVDHPGRVERATLAGKPVGAVAEEL